jgi:chromosome segregation ATPase
MAHHTDDEEQQHRQASDALREQQARLAAVQTERLALEQAAASAQAEADDAAGHVGELRAALESARQAAAASQSERLELERMVGRAEAEADAAVQKLAGRSRLRSIFYLLDY